MPRHKPRTFYPLDIEHTNRVVKYMAASSATASALREVERRTAAGEAVGLFNNAWGVYVLPIHLQKDSEK